MRKIIDITINGRTFTPTEFRALLHTVGTYDEGLADQARALAKAFGCGCVIIWTAGDTGSFT